MPAPPRWSPYKSESVKKLIYFFDDYENFSAENFLNFLPENRRKKFEKLKRKIDRDNCVISHLLMTFALKESGMKNFETVIGENGKPFLKSGEKFFNISHCSQGAAVAVADLPVGIDAQEKNGFNERVAKRFFSEAENDFIRSVSDKEEVFTRLWTLKESVIKCEGKTLADIGGFSFENCEKFFEKYEKKFSCLCEKNVLISVCGNEYFDEIKIVKTEDFI